MRSVFRPVTLKDMPLLGRWLAFDEGTPRVIIDPDPANGRAIRAHEKAGFRKADERMSLYGHAVLMARDAEG